MARSQVRRAITCVALCGLVLAGCGSGGGSGAADVSLTIGASLPLSGNLASFGSVIKAGYQEAVDEVNATGGVTVNGAKRQVKLLLRDNKSDPSMATSQSKAMVLSDGAVALLGSVSPPLTIPVSNVAETQRVPFITSLTPEQAWLAANKAGWKYAWNVFFDEGAMTDLQFATADLVPTNKKIALFTDTEEDGVAMGALWESKAPAKGYQIAYRANFPVGTADYGDFISRAKRAGAQVVIAQMVPPDAIALWKQMKALALTPKLAFCEKCANQSAWQRALGALADGTCVTDFWSPARGGGSAKIAAKFQPTLGKTLDVSGAAAAYTVAKILLDAITAADSDDPAAINTAIGRTDADHPLGHVRFDDTNRFPVPPVMDQWQGTRSVQVYPPGVGSAELRMPVAGLG